MAREHAWTFMARDLAAIDTLESRPMVVLQSDELEGNQASLRARGDG